MTVSGRTIGEIAAAAPAPDREVIKTADEPLKHGAGFIVLSGNFFDSAIMKMSVVGDAFRQTYLSEPGKENTFEARAIVFDGPEDYHARINDPSLEIDQHCILVIRGAGTVGYPGSAEVVNMAPPAVARAQGITSLPTLGDGRQSGTSASPSILNMSPEAAVGGGLSLLRTNDRIRVDLNSRSVNVLVDEEELARRRETASFDIPPVADAVAGAVSADGGPAFDRRMSRTRDAVSESDRRARQSAAFALKRNRKKKQVFGADERQCQHMRPEASACASACLCLSSMRDDRRRRNSVA